MQTKFIYALIDPTDDQVRWIGQCVDLDKRLLRHMSIHKNEANENKTEWIKNLKTKRLKPEILVLEKNLLQNDADFWETHYIALFYSWGYNLLNIQLGGQSSRIWDEKSKIRISKSLTGKKHSVETKSKRVISFYKSRLITYINADLLEELYITKNIKRQQVAMILGATDRLIKRRIKEIGLSKPNNYSSITLSKEQIESEISKIANKNVDGLLVGKRLQESMPYKLISK